MTSKEIGVYEREIKTLKLVQAELKEDWQKAANIDPNSEESIRLFEYYQHVGTAARILGVVSSMNEMIQFFAHEQHNFHSAVEGG
jgi:hypothetical protein